LIVGLDRFEGLDKRRLARTARAMNNPLNAAAVFRSHGNHKTIIPQRDVVLACLSAFRARKICFSDFLNRIARLPNICAYFA